MRRTAGILGALLVTILICGCASTPHIEGTAEESSPVGFAGDETIVVSGFEYATAWPPVPAKYLVEETGPAE
jgi:hypothetical protein